MKSCLYTIKKLSNSNSAAKKQYSILALLFLFTGGPKENNPNSNLIVMENQKLKITVDNKVAIVVLYDNATTRSFIDLLPLSADMTDFAGTEKIFYPSAALSTIDRKAVSDPKIGDINCYAPWGNIAIFYKNYSGSNDLIRIARITQGIEIFNRLGPIHNVTFELE